MKKAIATESLPLIPGARIAILQSKWYREHTDSMVARCIQTLRSAGCEHIDHHVLPGSLELPIAAQALLANRAFSPLDAIVCIGAVIKGDTYHFEMVFTECAHGLAALSLRESVPILNEVLPVLSIKELAERCGDDEFNKGIEAAVAAIEIIAWLRTVTVRTAPHSLQWSSHE